MAVSFPILAQGTSDACGEVVMLKTHSGTTMHYALSQPKAPPAQGGPIALVLLPGGGHADLDGTRFIRGAHNLARARVAAALK